MKFTKLQTFASAVALMAMTGPIAVRADAPQPLKVDRAESFHGVNQVILGQFSVAFFTKKVDYDGGGFMSFTDKAKAVGELSGMTDAQFQQITDAAYADFLKQMASNGITIADAAPLLTNSNYAHCKPKDQGSTAQIPLKKEDHATARVFWPTTLGRRDSALMPIGFMDSSFSWMMTAEKDAARRSHIPVINVVYVVDFAKPAKSTRGIGTDRLTVSAGLAISQFGSQVMMYDADGKEAHIKLNIPVEEGGNFADIRETTSAVSKGLRAAGIIGAGLFGHGGISTGLAGGAPTGKFTYTVTDPNAYAEKTQAGAATATDLFLRQIAALR